MMDNFSRLMPEAFAEGDWENALLQFARICKENKITWYLTGSACDAVRGIDVKNRYDTEIHRKRVDRIEAFERYLERRE